MVQHRPGRQPDRAARVETERSAAALPVLEVVGRHREQVAALTALYIHGPQQLPGAEPEAVPAAGRNHRAVPVPVRTARMVGIGMGWPGVIVKVGPGAK